MQTGQEARGGGGAALAGASGPVPAGPGSPVTVHVRFFAGAAAAAGLDEEVVLLDDEPTLGALVVRLRHLHPPLGAVLDVASTLVDEVAVSHVTGGATPLRSGTRVDVLPPFAGG